MFISIECDEKDLNSFIINTLIQLTDTIIIKKNNNRVLNLFLKSSSSEIKISEILQGEKIIKKPFHYSELIDVIRLYQDGYFETIGFIKFFAAKALIQSNNDSCHLSETQNKILSNLVCFRDGIDKKLLYKKIWPQDKNISDNKLDTHLTNLRNLIFDFCDYSLKFKSMKGKIKLDIS
ncbi:helix-turn-helix domain-containing protein [Alphaproteobacteria bacterium]|nr:helix-turn-helix domain-containing protein [Alphaproteobacteria bacterium]